MLTAETFIILANAEWDWETRVNCHHIAARLAQTNAVLFVDTIGGRTPAPREFNKVAKRLRRIMGGVRTIQPRLHVLAPFVIPIYDNELIRHVNTAIFSRQIRRAMPKNSSPILWAFLPAHVSLIGRLNEKLVIYHCVDEHAANPSVPTRQVIAQEQRLLGLSDVVFTTSSTLYESKRAFNPHTFYLPNVADAAFFAQAPQDTPEELKTIPRPIVGFIGNITAYKLDFNLIRSTAEQNPNCSFVFIGPVGRGDPSTDVHALSELKNIHLLGPRPYEQLPRYVNAFDVCLIPFRLNDSTRGTLPMKFFEFLAAGKPVIATELPALADFSDYYYCIRTANEFSSVLQTALHEGSSRQSRRVEIARKFSWDARMLEIERILQDALERKEAQGRLGLNV